jgi:hypothetical protein
MSQLELAITQMFVYFLYILTEYQVLDEKKRIHLFVYSISVSQGPKTQICTTYSKLHDQVKKNQLSHLPTSMLQPFKSYEGSNYILIQQVNQYYLNVLFRLLISF